MDKTSNNFFADYLSFLPPHNPKYKWLTAFWQLFNKYAKSDKILWKYQISMRSMC